MKTINLIVICLLMQACSTVGSVDRPASYYQHSNDSSSINELVGGSISEEDDRKINELLNYRVTLPEQNRIAVLKLNTDNYWRFYSNDFNQLNDSLVESFITRLRDSHRVYDASFLPAMLVPEKRTIPVLREAAARFQADLLLTYMSSCQSYQKHRLLSANENVSYCSIESVLLDVRSGIIVKSVVSTEDFAVRQSDDDVSFRESVKKAELEAIAKALGNVAEEVALFLENVPTMTAGGHEYQIFQTPVSRYVACILTCTWELNRLFFTSFAAVSFASFA